MRALIRAIRAALLRTYLRQLRMAASLVVPHDADTAIWQAWLIARAAEVRLELYRLASQRPQANAGQPNGA